MKKTQTNTCLSQFQENNKINTRKANITILLTIPTIEPHENKINSLLIEAVARGCSVKKVFLEISQNSQENTCARASFFNKFDLWHRCFPVNFTKFLLRTPFLTRTSPVAASVLSISYLRPILKNS